ncbi:hypothetical protein CDAR_164031 [Caerostris darwini]|uniref:Uncharacterized protein n=1 Tax=Caerostris darwini TaxID=1538125 RepID=A0AAV4UVS1_9ARAC|nr:hypothetical protein CDAR_164031 [Caerostris darwini]
MLQHPRNNGTVGRTPAHPAICSTPTLWHDTLYCTSPVGEGLNDSWRDLEISKFITEGFILDARVKLSDPPKRGPSSSLGTARRFVLEEKATVGRARMEINKEDNDVSIATRHCFGAGTVAVTRYRASPFFSLPIAASDHRWGKERSDRIICHGHQNESPIGNISRKGAPITSKACDLEAHFVWPAAKWNYQPSIKIKNGFAIAQRRQETLGPITLRTAKPPFRHKT